MFKKTYFEEHLQTTASNFIKKETPTKEFPYNFCKFFMSTYFDCQILFLIKLQAWQLEGLNIKALTFLQSTS